MKESCNHGWLYYSDNCYLVSQEQMSWHEAKLQCESNGAFLADINSAEENTWITDKIIDNQTWSDITHHVWIGANDIGKEGIFILSEMNSTLNFTNWNQEEPNDDSGEDCVASIQERGLWNDLPCSLKCSSICKKIN
ncbi:perlucin-like protein [Saccostrea cucullata]|uniref:perlucin-like protein n=1 Tax=Saccostrea cuccullata TaxID=36930 RepID=UPI002ED4E5EE